MLPLDNIEISEIEGGKVKIQGIALTSEDVWGHIYQGWQVSKMRFNYGELIEFSFDAAGILKSIKLLEKLDESLGEDSSVRAFAIVVAEYLKDAMREIFSVIDSN